MAVLSQFVFVLKVKTKQTFPFLHVRCLFLLNSPQDTCVVLEQLWHPSRILRALGEVNQFCGMRFLSLIFFVVRLITPMPNVQSCSKLGVHSSHTNLIRASIGRARPYLSKMVSMRSAFRGIVGKPLLFRWLPQVRHQSRSLLMSPWGLFMRDLLNGSLGPFPGVSVGLLLNCHIPSYALVANSWRGPRFWAGMLWMWSKVSLLECNVLTLKCSRP